MCINHAFNWLANFQIYTQTFRLGLHHTHTIHAYCKINDNRKHRRVIKSIPFKLDSIYSHSHFHFLSLKTSLELNGFCYWDYWFQLDYIWLYRKCLLLLADSSNLINAKNDMRFYSFSNNDKFVCGENIVEVLFKGHLTASLQAFNIRNFHFKWKKQTVYA